MGPGVTPGRGSGGGSPWEKLLHPDHSFLTVDVFELLGGDFDTIADVIVFFSVDAIGCFDEIFMEESFDAFDGDEDTVVIGEFDVAVVFLSEFDVIDGKSAGGHHGGGI